MPSGKKEEIDIDIEWRYGELKSGEYRIIKEVSKEVVEGKFKIYIISAEFTLEN